MDFPANTPAQRNWLRQIFSEINCEHQLIYLDVDDATCIRQIQHRRESSLKSSPMETESTFYQISDYFSAPEAEEGFKIQRISAGK